MDLPAQSSEEINSLEAPASADAAGGGSALDTPNAPDGKDAPPTPEDKKKKPHKRFQTLVTHVNIYLLLFILILVLSGIGVFVTMQRAKKEVQEPDLTVQDLSQEALEQIN